MFHLLQINSLARKIFKIMHDDLLPIWDEYSDSVVLGILLEAPLCLLDFNLDLLKAT
jgi:hypothetical protein